MRWLISLLVLVTGVAIDNLPRGGVTHHQIIMADREGIIGIRIEIRTRTMVRIGTRTGIMVRTRVRTRLRIRAKIGHRIAIRFRTNRLRMFLLFSHKFHFKMVSKTNQLVILILRG